MSNYNAIINEKGYGYFIKIGFKPFVHIGHVLYWEKKGELSSARIVSAPISLGDYKYYKIHWNFFSQGKSTIA